MVAKHGGSILGEEAWPDLFGAAHYLRQQNLSIDIVDVFRESEAVPAIADDAIAAGAHALWLQQGVIHEQAAQRARAARLVVEMDRCLMVEWFRIMGTGTI
jgi:predicted CoA-binding protein